jgi:hypothetical protein
MINFSKNLSNVVRGLMYFVGFGILLFPCWFFYYYSDISWAEACSSAAVFYVAMILVDDVWNKSEQPRIPYIPIDSTDDRLVDSFVAKKSKEKKNAIPLDKTEKK